MTPLDSDQLRTFLAIADGGSFTAAAGAVNRTQSAVSMQMKRLEARLGYRLFERGPRGVAPTPEAEALLGKARRVMKLLEEAATPPQADRLEGQLRIGLPEEYGADLLPRILSDFAEAHPSVTVTVRCGWSPDLDQALARGDLDLAIVVSDRPTSDGELLLYDPTVWVSSARHLVHEEVPLPLAMFEPGCWWRDWALRLLDRQDRAYRIAYTSPSVAGVKAAISAGLAVGLLGASVRPAQARVLSEDQGFQSLPGSHVVLRRGGSLTSPTIAGMAKAIARRFKEASLGSPSPSH